MAVNYGTTGATIGHEISHSFDDQGRLYDDTGMIRDWWTPEDAAAYAVQAQKIIDQYNAYEPLPGVHINGSNTQGENIADLAGLAIAYRAYHIALGGKELAHQDEGRPPARPPRRRSALAALLSGERHRQQFPALVRRLQGRHRRKAVHRPREARETLVGD